MYRPWSIFLVVLASLFNPSPSALAGQEDEVLLIVKDAPSLDLELMLTQEIETMRKMLEGVGLGVVIASPSGQPLADGNARVEPDLRVDAVDAADYVGIILPCMAMEEEPPAPLVGALVREAAAAGKPVAAQGSSAATLARAGLLKERDSPSSMSSWPTFPNSRASGMPARASSAIRTSSPRGCPPTLPGSSVSRMAPRA